MATILGTDTPVLFLGLTDHLQPGLQPFPFGGIDLYQLAQRSGLPAIWVTAIHWGFAGLGGVACLAFIRVPGAAKPFIPLLLIAPQLVWTIWVLRRARRAGLLGFDPAGTAS